MEDQLKGMDIPTAILPDYNEGAAEALEGVGKAQFFEIAIW